MHALILVALLLGLPAASSARGVQQFGSLQIGSRAPFGPGDPTAYPYKTVPKSAFYLFVVAKGLPTMCIYEECSEHGLMVKRLGGWITGDAQAESAAMVGLTEIGVQAGTESIVVLANRRSIIIGIYPGSQPSDVKRILQENRMTAKPRNTDRQ